MRIAGAILAFAGFVFAVAACSGGGGSPAVPHTVPANPKPTPTSGSASRASVSFTIALPPTTPTSKSRAHRAAKPLYVGTTTQGITIAIANPAATFAPITTSSKQCGTNGVCTLTATASLPVLVQPYTFTVTAYGVGGATDVLSEATSAPTVLSSGNTNIVLTLNAVVASASLAVSGQPTLGGTSIQTLPVSFQAFDPDGSLITGTTTQFAQPFEIGYTEVDPFGAFALVPGATGSASCMLSSSQCSLNSNADTLNVTFNPTATDFPSDQSYYQYEFDLYDALATALTPSNSVGLTTPPCITPNPICVYSPPLLQYLTAQGLTFANFAAFNPTLVSANGSTIWTDQGVIIANAPAPSYAIYPNSTVANQSIAALEVPASSSVFAPDYSGNIPQILDDISPSGAFSSSTYPADTNTLNGAASGAGIILGPDGNLWWIDPVTGVLRYANPASPSVVTTCLLQPASANVFLTAAQIVATPAGVSPSRIWFSAVDNFGGSTNFTYLGYINVPASGGNSCGNGQSNQYTAFDKADYGTPVPPNGLAVDGAGNAWYNDADVNVNSANPTAIGEATIGSSGTVTVSKAVLLPGQTTPGELGYATQAWGLVYDPLDGNMYFATDNGLIGRFNPTLGLSSVAAYALPSMLANLEDESEGPSGNDSECFAVPGPCSPQLAWDPGTSSKGRLTFTTVTSGSENFYSTATAQLDLGNTTVGFSSESRSHQTPRSKRSSHRLVRWHGRQRTIEYVK